MVTQPVVVHLEKAVIFNPETGGTELVTMRLIRGWTHPSSDPLTVFTDVCSRFGLRPMCEPLNLFDTADCFGGTNGPGYCAINEQSFENKNACYLAGDRVFLYDKIMQYIDDIDDANRGRRDDYYGTFFEQFLDEFVDRDCGIRCVGIDASPGLTLPACVSFNPAEWSKQPDEVCGFVSSFEYNFDACAEECSKSSWCTHFKHINSDPMNNDHTCKLIREKDIGSCETGTYKKKTTAADVSVTHKLNVHWTKVNTPVSYAIYAVTGWTGTDLNAQMTMSTVCGAYGVGRSLCVYDKEDTDESCENLEKLDKVYSLMTAAPGGCTFKTYDWGEDVCFGTPALSTGEPFPFCAILCAAISTEPPPEPDDPTCGLTDWSSTSSSCSFVKVPIHEDSVDFEFCKISCDDFSWCSHIGSVTGSNTCNLYHTRLDDTECLAGTGESWFPAISWNYLYEKPKTEPPTIDGWEYVERSLCKDDANHNEGLTPCKRVDICYVDYNEGITAGTPNCDDQLEANEGFYMMKYRKTQD